MAGQRKPLHAAVLGTLGLLLAACGTPPGATTSAKTTSTSPAPIAVAATTSFTEAGCAGGSGEIVQAMDGKVTACLRAGALGAGAYHVSLQQIIMAKGVSTGTTRASGPVVKLSLFPANGAPGTTITIKGTVAETLRPLPQYANFCWDGCANGLQYSGVPIDWSGTATFTARLVVPAAPWVESNPVRIIPPRAATFSIGVNCLLVAKGCGLGGAEGSATFTMTGVKKLSWCGSGADCASLSAGPATVVPGQIIKVQGYAPLVSVIGSDQPFDFQMQVMQGAPEGSQVEFKTLAKGGTEAFFGQAPVKIGQALTFAGLGVLSPGPATFAGPGSLTANPTDPATVFWCTGGYLSETGQSGTEQIPTKSAATLLASLGYGFMGSSAPNCAAIAPLPGNPGVAPAVAAAFTVSQGNYAPPVYNVALYTIDGGRTWTPVPPPQGASPTTFGGFRFAGGALEAVYAGRGTPGGAAQPTIDTVEMTSAAAGWKSGSLACPSSGPCATLGPFAPGNCAMTGTSQAILYSPGPGAGWQLAGWPGALSACASAELASIGAGRLLAIDSQSEYPVLLSTDGGRSWSNVVLPALPPSAVGTSGGTGLGVSAGQLLLLPNGALLAYEVGQPQSNALLLAPGKSAWCPVPSGVSLPRNPFSTEVGIAANSLWWVTYGPQQATTPVPHQVPLSQIAC